jgi:nucleoside-diphosphate-sugar epimerase
VVLGASGWLGTTFVALASKAEHDLLLVGSHSRAVLIDNEEFVVQEYDFEAIERFAPTVLIDFAFLTPEHLESTSEQEYQKVNEMLLQQALNIFALPSVSHGLFSSSGAAVYPKDAMLGAYSDNPYGYLKRRTEELALEAAERLEKKAVVIRPWSLSGTMVTKEYEFAFSSFVKQSFGDEIHVKSPNLVSRRYVAAEDFLAVSLAKLFSRSSLFELLDSGGELVSLVELAQKVADSQPHEVTVVSQQSNDEVTDRYYSDNVQWVRECEAFGFVPETLIEQISRNVNFHRLENGT